MSLFQKRHYEWLSRFAAETLDDGQQGALADALARDNVKFNRTRFLAAIDYGKVVRDRKLNIPLLARKRAAGVL